MAKSGKAPKGKAAAESRKEKPVVKNGWTLYAHPLLLDQIDTLSGRALAEANPNGDATKVLAWVTRAIFEEIPRDPTSAKYRQGHTLGKAATHWFRAKYAGRFRLFYRYDSRSRIVVFAWVNDENTLRTRGAKTDAYAVFKAMLGNGRPPDGWSELVDEASAPAARERLEGRDG